MTWGNRRKVNLDDTKRHRKLCWLSKASRTVSQLLGEQGLGLSEGKALSFHAFSLEES